MEPSPDFKDAFSAVPALDHILPEVTGLLRAEGRLAMISIELPSLVRLQGQFDRRIYALLQNAAKRSLAGLSGTDVRKEDIIASDIKDGNAWYIFLSKSRGGRYGSIDDIERISLRVLDTLYNKLFDVFYPLTSRGPEVKLGYASRFFSPEVDGKDMLSRLIADGQAMSGFLALKSSMMKAELFSHLLAEETLEVLYQPMIRLATNAIVGYDAFVSGPKNGSFRNAYGFYNYARETGREREIDWISRKHALLGAGRLSGGKKLFVKMVEPAIFDDCGKAMEFTSLAKGKGLSPGDLVFEFKDTGTLRDLTLTGRLSGLFPGVTFAVSVGPEWSQNFMALCADPAIRYLKVGIEIIRNIHEDQGRRRILENIIRGAHEAGKEVIAVGIHTIAEKRAVMEAGADIGQGYYFAMPGSAFGELSVARDYAPDKEVSKNLLASIYFKRGRDYYSRGEYDKCILEFTKVLELDSRSIQSLYYRGSAYLRENSPLAAMNDCAKIKAQDADYPYRFLLEGMTAEKQNDPGRAIVSYAEFLRRSCPSAPKEREFAQSRVRELEKNGR